MAEQVDVVVIGAGVVGLAVARALALAGRDVLVLERHGLIGSETSARNSEVVHAGIYYPTGSLKARLCVAGRERLYAYCAERGVAAPRLGKLIVAAEPGQIAGLEALHRQARANGVSDLRWLGPSEVAELEPELRCAAALLSPSTGIVDSHAFMLGLQGDLEAHGGVIAFHAPVLGGNLTEGGVRLRVGGAEPMELAARLVVNAAGLAACRMASALGAPAPTPYYARGHYFTLAGRTPFRRLVYPMPEPGGLGVHVTLDLGGQAKFGPDVQWVDAPDDYTVDPARAAPFYAAIRTYWPGLPEGALQPAYAGIRPKISGPGAPNADFLIERPHPALVNLFGIESPGLTSSLALADEVLIRLA